MEQEYAINLVDAKNEYTKQLISLIYLHIYNGIKSIYNDAEKIYQKDNSNSILKNFQILLCEVPKWNQEIIDSYTNKIIEETGCDWIDELITAVFISHTKILTSIKNNDITQKINLKIPKTDHFIHKCFIDTARCFYRNAYLFNSDLPKCEIQRNRRESEQLTIETIKTTIRKQLPIKQILNEIDCSQSINRDQKIEDSNDIDYQNNIKNLVKSELNQLNLEKSNVFNSQEKSSLEDNSSKNYENIEPNELLNETNNETNNEKNNETNNEIDNETNNEMNNETNNEINIEANDDLNQVLDLKNKTDKFNLDNKISDNELNEIIDGEIKTQNLELKIDELDLNDMDDLNDLEEIYEDKLIEKNDSNDNTVSKNTVEEINSVNTNEDSNVKKIQIHKSDSDIKSKILKKYSKDKNDYKFFN